MGKPVAVQTKAHIKAQYYLDTQRYKHVLRQMKLKTLSKTTRVESMVEIYIYPLIIFFLSFSL